MTSANINQTLYLLKFSNAGGMYLKNLMMEDEEVYLKYLIVRFGFHSPCENSQKSLLLDVPVSDCLQRHFALILIDFHRSGRAVRGFLNRQNPCAGD